MTSYMMSDRFIITGLQLGMLHMLTDYDDQATEIVEKVLTHKVEAEPERSEKDCMWEGDE